MRHEWLLCLIAYFLGSIPSGYIFVRMATGGDIRRAGSGNIGATNVFRKSKGIGVLTLIADAGKGYLAAYIAAQAGVAAGWQAAAAVAAIAGHIFPVWLGFRGGKGVATGCGAYLALSPLSVAAALAVFAATVAWTRYISLASILATATFPLWMYLLDAPPSLLAGAVVGCVLIVAKHHQNIRRLLAGTESRFAPGRRPST